MGKVAKVLPVIVFAGVAAVFGFGLRNDPKALPSMLLDRPLPEFSLPPLEENAKGLQSSEITGRPVTVLNVFASWCSGCRYEHPFLMGKSKEKRIRLVGLDWKDTPQHARDWLGKYGNPFETIGVDESGRTGIELGVTGVPETFVIDSEGRVRYRLPGPLTPEIWKETIEPLLAKLEKSP